MDRSSAVYVRHQTSLCAAGTIPAWAVWVHVGRAASRPPSSSCPLSRHHPALPTLPPRLPTDQTSRAREIIAAGEGLRAHPFGSGWDATRMILSLPPVPALRLLNCSDDFSSPTGLHVHARHHRRTINLKESPPESRTSGQKRHHRTTKRERLTNRNRPIGRAQIKSKLRESNPCPSNCQDRDDSYPQSPVHHRKTAVRSAPKRSTLYSTGSRRTLQVFFTFTTAGICHPATHP